MRKLIVLLSLLYIGSCTINNPVSYVNIPNGSTNLSSSTPVQNPPSAPVGLNVISGNAQNTVSWLPVIGATGYNLYFSTTPGVTKLNGTLLSNVTSPYIHTPLTNGTVYYYVVTSYDANGESVESSEVNARAGTVDNHDGSVFIASLNQTWSKCSDNFYNPVTDSCNLPGMPTHQFCATDTIACDNGTVLTSGDTFNVCASKGLGWRVPSIVELQGLSGYYDTTIFGIVQDWHWSNDAPSWRQVTFPSGLDRWPIWRTQVAYVVCVK